MASAYRKNNKIYITWYDKNTGKKKNKSTGMEYSEENIKQARKMAKGFQEEIDREYIKSSANIAIKGSLGQARDHFLENNQKKNKKTLAEYRRFFELFHESFPESQPAVSATKINCERWLLGLQKLTFLRNGKQQHYSQNSLYSFTKVLKKFLGFLFEYGYVNQFKLNSDICYSPETKPIIIFSQGDIATFFEGLKHKSFNFRIACYLLLFTGLRPTDIHTIKAGDVDLINETISYYSPKTKDYNTVSIHEALIPILKERIDKEPASRLLAYEKAENIGKAFRRYLVEIGLDGKGYTLRTFRKTFVSIAHDMGVDSAIVSKMVGHSNTNTTQKFYNKLSKAKMSGELNKIDFGVKEKTVPYCPGHFEVYMLSPKNGAILQAA